MLIEISSLPPVLEKAILQGEAVEFAQNGKVIRRLSDNSPTIATQSHAKSYANGDFNFDLELLQKSIDSGEVVVPKLRNSDDFLAWLNG